MQGEFRRGWKLVAASAIGIGVGMSPVPFYSIGVFVAPLGQEFGWTVGQVLTALAVLTVGAMVCAPLVGWLVDRVGVRSVVLASIVGFSVSLLLPALCGGSLLAFYAAYGVMAVAATGTLPITWTRAVNNAFVEKRGLALGLSLALTGLCGALVKLYTAWLIGVVGWRGAYVGLAALPLLVALPLALAWFHDFGRPEGGRAPDETGMTWGQAASGHRFWIMIVAFIVISFMLGGIIPNLESLFGAKGFDRGVAVWLASLIGYAVTLGRPVGGWLLDRLWPPAVAFVLLGAPALSFTLLAQTGLTTPFAAASVLLIGLGSGVEYDLLAFLVAHYFGLRAYGAIYGTVYAAFALGAGFGPTLIGRFAGPAHDYDPVLGWGAVTLLAGAALLLLLGRTPKPATAYPVSTR